MKKENFVSLLMAVVGGILFALGMCMCLLPQWNAFKQGVVVGIAGLAVLLLIAVVRRKMLGKPAIRPSGKAVATVALAVAGALVLGVGMCMTMVWQGLMIQGILVGTAGILLLLLLIPLCKGLK